MRYSQTSGADWGARFESQHLFYFLYLNRSRQRLSPTLLQCLTAYQMLERSPSLRAPNTPRRGPALTRLLLWHLGVLRWETGLASSASPPRLSTGQRPGADVLPRAQGWVSLRPLHWARARAGLSNILQLSGHRSPLQDWICFVGTCKYIVFTSFPPS